MSGLLNTFAAFGVTDWISFIVGLMMCLAPVLQIRAIRATGSSANVPMGVYIVFLVGSIVWFQSALSAGAAPIAFSEVVGMVTNGACLVFIHRYRDRGATDVEIEHPSGQERIGISRQARRGLISSIDDPVITLLCERVDEGGDVFCQRYRIENKARHLVHGDGDILLVDDEMPELTEEMEQAMAEARRSVRGIGQ